jgi:hypothetical protein
MGSLDVAKLNKTVPKAEFVIHHIWSMEACMRRLVFVPLGLIQACLL